MVKEIKVGRNHTMLVDDEDYERLKLYRWHPEIKSKKHRAVYARADIYKNSVRQHIVRAHRLVMNAPKGMQVDHINGNGLDNRKENLRLCTNSQNARNRGKFRITEQSPFKGVFKIANGRYMVQLATDGRTQRYGQYDCPEFAAKVYDFLASHFFGEFARLNFPCQKK